MSEWTVDEFLAMHGLRKGTVMDVEFKIKPPSDKLVTVKAGEKYHQSFIDSIILARAIAERATGKKFNGTLEVSTPRSLIDGGSGGMLLALTFMSWLTGTPLRKDTTGSATINQAGELGEVSGIPEKTDVFKKAGYTRFIIAENQTLEQPITGIELLRARTISKAWELCHD